MRQRIRRGIILFSFLAFPVTIFYFSPVLIIMGAAKGLVVGSMLTFAAMFVSSIVLGRGFCGWLCPAGGLQEMCTLVRDRPAAGGRWDWIKYVIWVPWIGGIALAIVHAGGLREIDPLYNIPHGISVSEPGAYIIYGLMVTLIAAVALAAGRRGFCHYVCWMAPFMVLGRKLRNILHLPSLKLSTRPDACIHCGKCVKACPMSLPVEKMVSAGDAERSECILCATCADVCPKRAIQLSFGR